MLRAGSPGAGPPGWPPPAAAALPMQAAKSAWRGGGGEGKGPWKMQIEVAAAAAAQQLGQLQQPRWLRQHFA